MKISKLTPVLCALAIGAFGFAAGAADTATCSACCAAPKAKPAHPAQPVSLSPVVPKATQTRKAGEHPAYPGADLGLKPIPAPPLPFGAGKADRLSALLCKYQADKLSPADYQQQRAAILAEP